ncbi:MAG: PEP-CTERM sorting domain-containing protein, partial [Planctomycetales bacterium]|nr:PEP-CTERM sorting domain-containing protein [Planctomycetales bacterium]
IDNSVGTAVNLSGKVALGYADIFTSVSNKPEFSFGIFDNLVVTQVPEPSSLALLLCGLPLLARRRK